MDFIVPFLVRKVELVSSPTTLEESPAFHPNKVGELSTYILKLPPTKNWRPILVEFDGQLNSVFYCEIGVGRADKKSVLRAAKKEVGYSREKRNLMTIAPDFYRYPAFLAAPLTNPSGLTLRKAPANNCGHPANFSGVSPGMGPAKLSGVP